MLQELAAETGASVWAIGSMFFFLAAWIAVVIWLARKPRDEMEARARLPLEDSDGTQDSEFGIRKD